MKSFYVGAGLVLATGLSFAIGEARGNRGQALADRAEAAVLQQDGQATTADALVALERQSWEAWKNRDSKFFERFLSNDHVELGFTGPANKALVVSTVASPNCTVKSYAVDSFKVVMLAENAAAVTYHAAQETTCNGAAVPSPVWVTSTYIKHGDKWLNAVYQQSQDIRRK